MTETWKPVLGWEKYYEVSDLGRLRSLPRPDNPVPRWRYGKILKPTIYKGYHAYSLQVGKINKRRFISRIVLESFTGKQYKPYEMHAAHKNGNPGDNRLANLYWATISENQMDRHKHGTMMAGKNHPNYKHGRYIGTKKKKLKSAEGK